VFSQGRSRPDRPCFFSTAEVLTFPREKIFHFRYFFLALEKTDSYAARAKGEGEAREGL
jgi:hypothetical protein